MVSSTYSVPRSREPESISNRGNHHPLHPPSSTLPSYDTSYDPILPSLPPTHLPIQRTNVKRVPPHAHRMDYRKLRFDCDDMCSFHPRPPSSIDGCWEYLTEPHPLMEKHRRRPSDRPFRRNLPMSKHTTMTVRRCPNFRYIGNRPIFKELHGIIAGNHCY